mmetsp:Transcript_5329/g.16304  ORF Transcript_5329/g.16304 Transcript_5329/m.16304 type:complete len:243 (+) Transcript_5329:1553-2281(+)
MVASLPRYERSRHPTWRYRTQPVARENDLKSRKRHHLQILAMPIRIAVPPPWPRHEPPPIAPLAVEGWEPVGTTLPQDARHEKVRDRRVRLSLGRALNVRKGLSPTGHHREEQAPSSGPSKRRLLPRPLRLVAPVAAQWRLPRPVSLRLRRKRLPSLRASHLPLPQPSPLPFGHRPHCRAPHGSCRLSAFPAVRRLPPRPCSQRHWPRRPSPRLVLGVHRPVSLPSLRTLTSASRPPQTCQS